MQVELRTEKLKVDKPSVKMNTSLSAKYDEVVKVDESGKLRVLGVRSVRTNVDIFPFFSNGRMCIFLRVDASKKSEKRENMNTER